MLRQPGPAGRPSGSEAAGEPYGFNLEELAELYLARGEHDKARSYFARAWPLLAEIGWFAESEPQRLERIKKLAE